MAYDVTVSQVTTLEQAEGVRQLFLAVYAQAYPVALYYEPELLLQKNRDATLLSMIASSPNGDVVGHCGLYNSAPNPKLKEVGAALVHSGTRGQGVAAALGRSLVEQVLAQDLADWLFTEAVCNHSATQIASAKQGFVETALELSLMPAKAYLKEASAKSRVSTLLSFLPLRDSGASIYVPSRYRERLEACVSSLGVERRIRQRPLATVDLEQTVLQRWVNEAAGVVRLQVDAIGRDLPLHFNDTAEVSQLFFRLSSPDIAWAIEQARAAGFFFGGYLPSWFETGDGLLMQRLRDEPDWDGMVLASPWAKSFAKEVRSERQTGV